MSDVKRYDWRTDVGCMIEEPDGNYVESADYDALLAEKQRIVRRLCACRDCGGKGEIYSGRSIYQGHFQPPEPEMDKCGTCDGDGVLGPLEDFEALAAERDQLRAELSEYQEDTSYATACETIRKLRAELEAIRGQQPVATVHSGKYASGMPWLEVEWHVQPEPSAGTKLYALPPQQPDAVSVPGVLEFAVEILRGALEGGNFDDGDIQEMGVRHGLLFPERRTERCGEYCECAEYGFPVECFRIARALLSTKNAEEGE